MKREAPIAALVVACVALGGAALELAARAYAVPAPEVEYVYDVMVRRQYNFANPGEAVSDGYGICQKLGQGESYAQLMSDVKHDVVPSDEFAANYLVSNAVGILCPAQIWQLRNSSAGYRPSPG